MSNNFYWFPSKKSIYNNLVSLHIGKSTGHSFNFHGVIIKAGEQIVDCEGVFFRLMIPALCLTSNKEWKAFLENNDGIIQDERGLQYSVDNFVNQYNKKDNKSHYKYCDGYNKSRYKWGYEDHSNQNKWSDEDGYTFYKGIFS